MESMDNVESVGMDAGPMESMIRLSRETVELLRGVEHNECIPDDDAAYCLAINAPIYSMCGGMLTSGQDILDNEEENDPYAARVRADMRAERF